MRVYWYAPFNNTDELLVAQRLAQLGETVTFHSLRTRFGRSLPATDEHCEIVRNLPEPAGDDGGNRGYRSRALVALTRAHRRDRLLRKRSFDVFHLHTLNPFTDGVAVPLLRRRHTPIVLTVHNVREHGQRVARPLETSLLKPLYRAADLIIVAHDVLGDELAAEFRVSPERIRIIPHVIPEIEPVTKGPERNGVPVCLFLGTFRVNKGIPLLLEAIRGLGSELPARFHFAGRGDRGLEDLVRKSAKGDSRISAEIGYVQPARMAELYQAASAVIMPYGQYSAQSGILREAYGFGVPVVVTDVGALGQAVRDESTGWVAAPHDARALSEAIRDALLNTEKRKLAIRAMKRVSEVRSPQATASRIRALYRTAIGRS